MFFQSVVFKEPESQGLIVEEEQPRRSGKEEVHASRYSHSIVAGGLLDIS
jgi:hypothetical protein